MNIQALPDFFMRRVRGYMRRMDPSQKDFSEVGAVISVVFFIFLVRIIFVLTADFPINDGGFFYTMIDDLIRSHFLLPKYITYNHASIPFAYPPLGFYVAGFLTKFFHIDYLTILRFLPLLITIGGLPVLYRLTLKLTNSAKIALLGLLFYGLTPGSFEWLIMGAGLTRSFGLLFALLTVSVGYRWLVSEERKALLTIVFLACTLLSHAEGFVFAGYSLCLMVLFFRKSGKLYGLFLLFLAGLTSLLLVSPWWMTVIAQHGTSPFVSALHARHPTLTTIRQLFMFSNFAEEPLMPIVMFAGLLGLLVVSIKKQFFLPAWIICIFIFSPTVRQAYVSIPLSMLGGIGVVSIIGESINRLAGARARRPVFLGVVVFLIYYLFINLYNAYPLGLLPFSKVNSYEREGMSWAASHTEKTSRFLVVSPHTIDWWSDALQEWFPALTNRVSLTTVQGYEWLPDFQNREVLYHAVKDCEAQNLPCLESVLSRFQLTISHVFVSTAPEKPLAYTCCKLLLKNLQQSSRYTMIYQNREVSIWKVR